MNIEDAIKIVTLSDNIDGGCSYCASYFLIDVMRTFPEVNWKMVQEKLRPDSTSSDNLESAFRHMDGSPIT